MTTPLCPLTPTELRELASLSYGDAAAHILKNETKLRGDLSTPYVAALHRLAFVQGYIAAATARDKEIEELRARVKELEGMVPRKIKQEIRWDKTGRPVLVDVDPPIPLPEGKS